MMPEGLTASARDAFPVITLVSPTALSAPAILWTRALLRSPSMRRVRRPPWAKLAARLRERVVLPSRGPGLVRSRVRASFPLRGTRSAVRIARIDSTGGVPVRPRTRAAPTPSSPIPATAGTTPRNGRPFTWRS